MAAGDGAAIGSGHGKIKMIRLPGRVFSFRRQRCQALPVGLSSSIVLVDILILLWLNGAPRAWHLNKIKMFLLPGRSP